MSRANAQNAASFWRKEPFLSAFGIDQRSGDQTCTHGKNALFNNISCLAKSARHGEVIAVIGLAVSPLPASNDVEPTRFVSALEFRS